MDYVPALIENLRTSEMRYRRLFESARDGILILDAVTRKITDVNPFMVELLHYTREEFLGKELWEIGLLKDEESSIIAFEELQRNNYIRYEDLPLKTKNGERREVEFVSNVYIENERQVIQCNIRDITERKISEKNIFNLAAIVESSDDAIISKEFDGTILSWNKAAENIFGYTAKEIIGQNISILFPPELLFEESEIIKKIKSGKLIQNFETVRLRKDGSRVPISLSNSPIKNIKGEIVAISKIAQDITERKLVEEALRQVKTNFRQLVESAPGIVYLNEPYPPYSTVYISPNIKTFGYSPEEWRANPDMWSNILHKEDRERVLRESGLAAYQGVETDLEYRIVARDGTIHWCQDKGHIVLDEQGNRTGWQGIILDITKTKGLEEQLRQSQKLESIGLLAGGIAHDFNNMLTAINGYSDLTLRQLKADDPLCHNIEEIKKAGLRSAVLTYQLLAFSRQQVLMPVVTDLNEIITDITKMLHRLINEDIQFTTKLNSKIGRVIVDPGQFSQILMNLIVNARDAMPRGGKLTIETTNVFLEPTYTRQHHEVLPGAYVLLAVSDTGTGMSDEIKKHIFEPFFTTKKVGQGTGLGLATVYGIVKQSRGNIEVYSEEGIGTTFKIYLPRVTEQIATTKIKETSFEMAEGTEAILLVEDEELVRNLSREILEICGYTVTTAGNGAEALEVCEKEGCKFDLLMTDVVMPQMGGRELAEKLAEKLPNLRILFTSGYTDDAILHHGLLETSANFIQKPFTFEELARKVRGLLDAGDSKTKT